MRPGKYSMGIGDRFARQGMAQLDAIIQAQRQGTDVTPVWNKSHREHTIVGSRPEDVRARSRRRGGGARLAAALLRRRRPRPPGHGRRVRRDQRLLHARRGRRDRRAGRRRRLAAFVRQHERYVGRLDIPGIDRPLVVTEETIRNAAESSCGRSARPARSTAASSR